MPAMPCIFNEEKKNDYKISMIKVQSQPVYRPMFSYLPYKGKLQNQLSVSMWEEHLQKSKYCTF
jgi:hypothetical protein